MQQSPTTPSLAHAGSLPRGCLPGSALKSDVTSLSFTTNIHTTLPISRCCFWLKLCSSALPPKLPNMAATAPALNLFAAKQNLAFTIVSFSDEKTWKEPTLCIRLLLLDGSQLELRAVKEAKTQFQALGIKAHQLPSQNYSMEVTRASIRPYKNAHVTASSLASLSVCNGKP